MLVAAPHWADVALLQPEPRTQAKTEEKEKDETKDGLKP